MWNKAWIKSFISHKVTVSLQKNCSVHMDFFIISLWTFWSVWRETRTWIYTELKKNKTVTIFPLLLRTPLYTTNRLTENCMHNTEGLQVQIQLNRPMKETCSAVLQIWTGSSLTGSSTVDSPAVTIQPSVFLANVTSKLLCSPLNSSSDYGNIFYFIFY